MREGVCLPVPLISAGSGYRILLRPRGPLASSSSLASPCPAQLSPARPSPRRTVSSGYVHSGILFFVTSEHLFHKLVRYDHFTIRVIFHRYGLSNNRVEENMILAFPGRSAKPPCSLIALHELIRLNAEGSGHFCPLLHLLEKAGRRLRGI